MKQELKYFPYPKVRKEQERLCKDIHGFLRDKDKNVMLFQGECGLGKESAVASQIVLALKNKLYDRIIWLIPTSGGKINIKKELDIIFQKTKFNVTYLSSKEMLCNRKKELEKKLKEKIDAYELCSILGKKCPHFKEGTCQYYNQMKKLKKAKIVVCDYNYFLYGFIKERVFTNFLKDKRTLFIVNEVHKLPDRCKRSSSRELSKYSVEKAIGELESEILPYSKVKFEALYYLEKFLKRFNKTIYENSSEIEKEKRMSGSDMGTAEMYFSDIIKTKKDLNMAKKMISLGKRIAKYKLDNDIGVISWTKTVGSFISRMNSTKGYSYYVYYIQEYKMEEGKRHRIGFSSLDPYPVMRMAFKNANKIILYSGTCYPERYIRLLKLYKWGEVYLPEPYASPFLKNRKDIFFRDGLLNLKGRRNKKTIQKSSKDLNRFLTKLEKPIGISCVKPLWARIKPFLNLGKYKLLEEDGMTQENLDKWLKTAKSEDIIQYSPFGRVAQSVDMRFLKSIIMLGVPVSKMDLITRKELEYHRKRFEEKGMEGFWIAYRIIATLPACERAIQSVMRSLRTQKDSVTVVWFDKRWVTNNYAQFVK